MYRLLLFAPPLFCGRSVFKYNFLLLFLFLSFYANTHYNYDLDELKCWLKLCCSCSCFLSAHFSLTVSFNSFDDDARTTIDTQLFNIFLGTHEKNFRREERERELCICVRTLKCIFLIFHYFFFNFLFFFKYSNNK